MIKCHKKGPRKRAFSRLPVLYVLVIRNWQRGEIVESCAVPELTAESTGLQCARGSSLAAIWLSGPLGVGGIGQYTVAGQMKGCR
jgi:hypothetical protein